MSHLEQYLGDFTVNKNNMPPTPTLAFPLQKIPGTLCGKKVGVSDEPSPAESKSGAKHSRACYRGCLRKSTRCTSSVISHDDLNRQSSKTLRETTVRWCNSLAHNRRMIFKLGSISRAAQSMSSSTNNNPVANKDASDEDDEIKFCGDGEGVTFQNSESKREVASPSPLSMMESHQTAGDVEATTSPYVPYPPRNTPLVRPSKKRQTEADRSPRYSLSQDPYNEAHNAELSEESQEFEATFARLQTDPDAGAYTSSLFPPALQVGDPTQYPPVAAPQFHQIAPKHGFVQSTAAAATPNYAYSYPPAATTRRPSAKADAKRPAARRGTRNPKRKALTLPTGEATRQGPTAEELALAVTPRAQQALQTWYDRLHELTQYRNAHGDCNVPQKYDVNRQLGIWVNKQRMEKKFMDQGQKTSMSEAKVRALERIGFTWAKLKGQASWDEKYAQLAEYQAEYGHCNVPTKYRANPALGRWVSTQRSQYKEFREGHQGHMTQDRFDRLVRLGFRWNMMDDSQMVVDPPARRRSTRATDQTAEDEAENEGENEDDEEKDTPVASADV